MSEGKITDKIYHGCATRYSNGERLLINFENGESALFQLQIHPGQKKVSKIVDCKQGIQQNSENWSKDQSNLLK